MAISAELLVYVGSGNKKFIILKKGENGKIGMPVFDVPSGQRVSKKAGEDKSYLDNKIEELLYDSYGLTVSDGKLHRDFSLRSLSKQNSRYFYSFEVNNLDFQLEESGEKAGMLRSSVINYDCPDRFENSRMLQYYVDHINNIQ